MSSEATPTRVKPRRRSVLTVIVEGLVAIVSLLTLACILLPFFALINVCQLAGLLLKFNGNLYDRYQKYFKGLFGITLGAITEYWSPTEVQVSWDSTIKEGMIKLVKGKLVTALPDHAIVIANHQIYTDWLYIWWLALVNGCHDSIFIVLKAILRWVPILGTGMMFYRFMFLHRDKSGADKKTLKKSIKSLNKVTGPMWALIFPEGTNATRKAREKSKKATEARGEPDFNEVLDIKAGGTYLFTQGLEGTVKDIISLTIGYGGVGPGQFAEEEHTLWTVLGLHRSPKVHIHFSQLASDSLPTDEGEFRKELTKHWRAKDVLMSDFAANQHFPPIENGPAEYLELRMGLNSRWELLHFTVPLVAGPSILYATWAAYTFARSYFG